MFHRTTIVFLGCSCGKIIPGFEPSAPSSSPRCSGPDGEEICDFDSRALYGPIAPTKTSSSSLRPADRDIPGELRVAAGATGRELQEICSEMRFDALVLMQHSIARATGKQYAKSCAGRVRTAQRSTCLCRASKRKDRSICRLSTSLWQSWITDRIRLWTSVVSRRSENFACAYSCQVQQIIDQAGFELQVTV
jgi:hypothetical protein